MKTISELVNTLNKRFLSIVRKYIFVRFSLRLLSLFILMRPERSSSFLLLLIFPALSHPVPRYRSELQTGKKCLLHAFRLTAMLLIESGLVTCKWQLQFLC